MQFIKYLQNIKYQETAEVQNEKINTIIKWLLNSRVKKRINLKLLITKLNILKNTIV